MTRALLAHGSGGGGASSQLRGLTESVRRRIPLARIAAELRPCDSLHGISVATSRVLWTEARGDPTFCRGPVATSCDETQRSIVDRAAVAAGRGPAGTGGAGCARGGPTLGRPGGLPLRRRPAHRHRGAQAAGDAPRVPSPAGRAAEAPPRHVTTRVTAGEPQPHACRRAAGGLE